MIGKGDRASKTDNEKRNLNTHFPLTFDGSGMISRYNLRSFCLAAILFLMTSTAVCIQIQLSDLNKGGDLLKPGSFSGIGVSGLTVLF